MSHDSQSEEELKEDTENQISIAIKNYLHKLDALKEMLPLVAIIVAGTKNKSEQDFKNFLKDHGTLIDESGSIKTYTFKAEHQRQAKRLEKKYQCSSTGQKLIPRHFLVSFVSEYDSFLGNLIKSLFNSKPELLNSTDRNISFLELTKFNSIANAREHILEKEIESVLRKSHNDQFKWLEDKFDIPLRKGLDSWKYFIELTERRNLFVHCNGIVSSQYLSVCAEHSIESNPDIKLNTELNASKNYLLNSYSSLYEIGVKLSQVLWRKILPDQIKEADSNLTEITYNLLLEENYDLAIELLNFACDTLKRWGSDQSKRVFIINKAQAYKHKGDTEKCLKTISEHDWTSCNDDFKICIASLKENYEEVANYMRKNGKDGSIDETAYLNWPVFKSFRETEIFSTAFQDVFGKEPYKTQSVPNEISINFSENDVILVTKVASH